MFDVRRLAVGIMLVVLAGLLGAGALARGPVLVVPGRSIGRVALGISASALAQAWGSPRQRPAKQGPDYRWLEYPERSAWVLVYKGRAVRMGVESSGYATAEGFSVGTRSTSITRRWGPGSRRRAVPWTEQPGGRPEDSAEPHVPTERFFLDYTARGISFLVDTTLDRVMALHIYPPRRT